MLTAPLLLIPLRTARKNQAPAELNKLRGRSLPRKKSLVNIHINEIQSKVVGRNNIESTRRALHTA